MSTPTWLVTQYARARDNKWIPMFRDSASKYGHRTEDLLAIASHESNLQNIKGDIHDGVAHGYSLMQLDINSYGEWIRSGAWKDVAKAIDKGAECLAAKRDTIRKASKQKVCLIKFRSGKVVRFTPKPFNDEQLRQMTIAAYNCGLAAYYYFSLGNPIDSGTTGKTYSRDVLRRSQMFLDLMVKDHFGDEQPAPIPAPVTPDPPASADDDGDADKTPDTSTPPPPQAVQSMFPFGDLKDKYDRHADLIQSDTTKSIAVKAGTRGGGLLITIWGTTTGRLALILTGALLVGVSVYLIVKYRYTIKAFITQAWAFIKGEI